MGSPLFDADAMKPYNFYFFGCTVQREIFVPQPGIALRPLQGTHGVVTTGLQGKSPKEYSFIGLRVFLLAFQMANENGIYVMLQTQNCTF